MKRPPRADATVAQVLAPVLRQGVADFRRAESDVRLDRVPAVHELRIAGRRLRSILGSAHTMFESNQDLLTGLRAAGRLAGAPRDTDVLSRRLLRTLADEPAGAEALGLLERLEHELEGRRRRQWLTLVDYLDGPDFDRLVRRLDSFSDLTPWSPLAGQPARDVLLPMLDLQRRQFNTMLHRLPGGDSSDELDNRLHDLRKRAKTLRYLSEALTPAVGERAKRNRKAMRRVQTVLGDLNDSLLLLAFLDQELRHEGLDREERRLLRGMRLRVASNAELHRSEFLDARQPAHRRTSAS